MQGSGEVCIQEGEVMNSGAFVGGALMAGVMVVASHCDGCIELARLWGMVAYLLAVFAVASIAGKKES